MFKAVWAFIKDMRRLNKDQPSSADLQAEVLKRVELSGFIKGIRALDIMLDLQDNHYKIEHLSLTSVFAALIRLEDQGLVRAQKKPDNWVYWYPDKSKRRKNEQSTPESSGLNAALG